MTKSLKNKIEELEQKYRFISDNLLDAIWVVNAETLKYEYITTSVEKISGYTADEHLNLAIGDVLTPESMEKAMLLLAEEKKRFSRGKKVSRTMELELIHKEGRTYWIEIRAKFYKEKGKPLKIVGVAKDISERKRGEKRQDELIQKLGEALAEKERLLKENKVLRGLLPICSGCKRIRDENDKWWPLDVYITRKTDTKVTHTLCPDCAEVFYGDQLRIGTQ